MFLIPTIPALGGLIWRISTSGPKKEKRFSKIRRGYDYIELSFTDLRSENSDLELWYKVRNENNFRLSEMKIRNESYILKNLPRNETFDLIYYFVKGRKTYNKEYCIERTYCFNELKMEDNYLQKKEELKRKIKEPEVPTELQDKNLKEVNFLAIGFKGQGKSSFINTNCSVQNGQYQNVQVTGESQGCITQGTRKICVNKYQGSSGNCKINIYDIKGFQLPVANNQDLKEKLSQTISSIKTRDGAVIGQVFLITTLEEALSQNDTTRFYKCIHQYFQQKDINVKMIFTKIDVILNGGNNPNAGIKYPMKELLRFQGHQFSEKLVMAMGRYGLSYQNVYCIKNYLDYYEEKDEYLEYLVLKLLNEGVQNCFQYYLKVM